MKIKYLLFSFLIALNSCVPNSAIPSMPGNGNNIISPLDPLKPIQGDPLDPNNPNPLDPNEPNIPVPNQPINPDHPAPPDPNQPTTEDDFWKLMQRFGFMQKRTKAELHEDIIKTLKTNITGWTKGNAKDIKTNINNKYSNSDTKKYMNPYPPNVDIYEKQSLTLAKKNMSDVDFYVDIEYGAKDGRGYINIQRIQPKTLEVLYFNKSGFITNYTQTYRPENGAPPPLLRLTHFMFIPPAIYNGK